MSGSTHPRGVKRAPEGYYTAKQAQALLGLDKPTFYYYVKSKKIKKYVPPLRTEGFYSKKEIDRLAIETALFFHTLEDNDKTVTRIARPEDAEGIYDVLKMGLDWDAAPVELRLSWHKVNPLIEYVVEVDRHIAGYVSAVPYTPLGMDDRISCRRESWDMKPEDILPYTPGTYDVFIGIAVDQRIPNHTRLGFRLISGFFDFLGDLAAQGVIIRYMYAVSDEKPGQKLCEDLKFQEMAIQPDYRNPTWKRYVLDLETSDSRFARQYRESSKRKDTKWTGN